MNQRLTIENFLKNFQRDVPLSSYTTFKIGGPAKYFFEAKTKEDLIKAINGAKKFNLPFFILGEGSNLLVGDEGFDGLVMKIRNTKYEIRNTKIYVEAGMRLGDIVTGALKKSLTDLEWAAGIPGTVGGAIRGNVGAFGSSISDVVGEVEVFDSKTGKIERLKNRDCQFDYKDSIFKQNPLLVILSAKLELEKGKKKEIGKKIKEYLEYREQNHPLDLPSAGCIFENPSSFPAGFLIDKCGLKGKRMGQAQISEKHANFIVNLGNAKAKDVKKLINLIKEKVKEKFGIELEEEIEYLGF